MAPRTPAQKASYAAAARKRYAENRDDERLRKFIARIKKEFTDASHNVPAYIIGGGNTVAEFCSDDREPAGT
jgi:putative IMPACT (imprinted ancient) family translation regulator